MNENIHAARIEIKDKEREIDQIQEEMNALKAVGQGTENEAKQIAQTTESLKADLENQKGKLAKIEESVSEKEASKREMIS